MHSVKMRNDHKPKQRKRILYPLAVHMSKWAISYTLISFHYIALPEYEWSDVLINVLKTYLKYTLYVYESLKAWSKLFYIAQV